jgi:hypothetical protein
MYSLKILCVRSCRALIPYEKYPIGYTGELIKHVYIDIKGTVLCNKKYGAIKMKFYSHKPNMPCGFIELCKSGPYGIPKYNTCIADNIADNNGAIIIRGLPVSVNWHNNSFPTIIIYYKEFYDYYQIEIM